MKKTILLINPCYNKKDTLGPFLKYITSQLPLSIGFLAGYLETKGYATCIIDEQLKQTTEEELGSLIEAHGIKVVGFTVLTLTARRAYELAASIKRKWPAIKIVMGGVHATLLPAEPIEKGVADFVVRQEGELTLHELLEAIEANGTYENIQGLSFKKDGEVIHNPPRPFIADLDILPPFPYHLFKANMKSYQFGNMLTSRGCPYACIFCSQALVSGRRYRTKSPDKVVEELDTLVHEYKQDFIFFNDDNFIVNKKNVHELCDKIIARNYPANLKLGLNARGDSLDKPLLEHMKAAHFTMISFGLETGSDRIMKLVKKGETVAQIAEGVRLAHEAGFIASGQFILGFPTETRAESIMTIKHALRIPLDFTRFNLLVPYPGSEIFEIVKLEQGKISKDSDWSNYASHSGLTGKDIPYVPQGRTAEDLFRLQWWGNLIFYLRPRQMLNLRNLRYATGGQVVLPDSRSLKGFLELIWFFMSLMAYLAAGLVRNKLWPSKIKKPVS